MPNQYFLFAIIIAVSVGLAIMNMVCPWIISTVFVAFGLFSAYGVFKLSDD